MSWLDRQTNRWRRWSESWRERWGLESSGLPDLDEDLPPFGHPVLRRMFRGDTLAFMVQVLQPDPGTGHFFPVDMSATGWNVRCAVKYQAPDPDQQAVAFLTSAPSGGIVFNNAPLGLFTVTVPPTATQFFPDTTQRLIYDVRTTDPIGNVTTVERGHIVVLPNSTRASGAL
jgi:hypothetical protein